MTTAIGLRERKKQRTRKLLSETARRLFAERGFEQVSIAEIARAAEVSEATVFNYFPTKEDLVFSGLEAFEEQLLAAIRDRPPEQSVLDAFGEFVLRPRGFLVEPDEAKAAQMVALTSVIAASPTLQARERQILDGYTDALAKLLAAEARASSADVRPYVAASALIGLHQALIRYVRERVVDGAPDRRRLAREMRRRGQEALTLLAGGLGEYAGKR